MKRFCFLLLMCLVLVIGCQFNKKNYNVVEPCMSEYESEQVNMEIIYVPGWLKGNKNEEVFSIIREIYPNAKVSQFNWDNIKTWGKSKRNADKAAETFADYLSDMSEERRANTIIIGHSLGGRMCVRALAILSERRIKISQAILLAAAIPHDDIDIGKAMRGTTLPILNMCNPKDVTLKYIYSTLGENMQQSLGANGRLVANPLIYDIAVPNDIVERTVLFDNNKMANTKIFKQVINHHACFYLNYLKEQYENNFDNDNVLIVHQDKVNLELPVVDKKIWWVEEDACFGWSLQKNKITGHYRILNNDKHRVAWGDKTKMIASFDKIKNHLTSEQ